MGKRLRATNSEIAARTKAVIPIFLPRMPETLSSQLKSTLIFEKFSLVKRLAPVNMSLKKDVDSKRGTVRIFVCRAVGLFRNFA